MTFKEDSTNNSRIHILGENSYKPHIWQEDSYLEYIKKRTHNTAVKKNKPSNEKMDMRYE